MRSLIRLLYWNGRPSSAAAQAKSDKLRRLHEEVQLVCSIFQLLCCPARTAMCPPLSCCSWGSQMTHACPGRGAAGPAGDSAAGARAPPGCPADQRARPTPGRHAQARAPAEKEAARVQPALATAHLQASPEAVVTATSWQQASRSGSVNERQAR